MKRLLLATILLLGSLFGTEEAMAIVVVSPPPACVSGTFDTYTSLTTGCTIGSYLFSNFMLSTTGDSASFDPDQIFVSPYLTAGQAGLDFTLSGPDDGIFRLAPISYLITGLYGSTITGADLTFIGAPGPAEVDQNQCLNGVFVPGEGGGTTCTGVAGAPITIVDQGESPNPSGTDFDAASSLGVMTDASSLPPLTDTDFVSGRSTSDATDPVLFSFGSRFTIGAVPEPMPLLLLAIGFLSMAGIRRMRSNA